MATSTSYGQYCPLSRALDVLGERWSLMIIRDLYAGTSRFNVLARGLPGLSRGLLSRRLRQLEAAGVVDHVDGHYRLSPAGRDLEPVLFGLGTWGARWAFGDPVPAELDPDLLVWWMRDRIDTTPWPGERHVIHIAFTDDKRQYWIVVERGEASVCRTDPGFDIAVALRTDVSTLYQVWLGQLGLAAAQRARRLVATGHRAFVRDLSLVLQLSPMAAVGQAAPPGQKP